MPDNETADVIERLQHAAESDDLDALRGFFADELAHDFSRSGIEVDPTSDEVLDRAREAGPFSVRVEDVVTDGRSIAGRFRFTASAEHVPGAKPGTSTDVTGLALAKIRDGKIVEVAHEIDTVGMLLALGMSVGPAE